MKRILLTSVFSLLSIIDFAQNKQRDSLKHELGIGRQDTTRVLVLVQLINSYKFDIPDSAFFYGQQAVALARQIKFPKGEIRALFFLATTYYTLGNFSDALELDLKSLQIADKNNLISEKAGALMHLGNRYVQFQNYSKALIYLHQALNLSDSNTLRGSRFLTLVSLVDAFLEMNKLDSSEYYSKLTSDYLKQHNESWMRAGYLRTVWKLHNKKGETQHALDFLRRSLIYDSTSAGSSQPMCEIAKIYQQTNRLDSAVYYGKKSLDIAQKTNSYSNIITSSKLLAQLYERKDAQKAIEYNKITIAAEDSLNNFGKTNAFKSITEFDEKERQYEIEAAKTDYKNKTRQYLLLTGVGVFLLITFILYRNNERQKEANNLLQQQKEKIKSALSQLQSTQSQLIQSEKMASLGELTAGIAHEIQNPLNFVNNFSDVNTELLGELKNELTANNKDEALALAEDIIDNEQKINHHGKRADAIVKGMLQHSRASTGKKEPTDINALADEYLRLAYHGLRAKDKDFNADFKTDFDESISKIEVVPQDIGRVLLNLYNNAFQAVAEKKKHQGEGYLPTVKVATKRLDNKIEIIVTDNGTGIPDRVVDKIFQPFFTTKPTGQGTGLGLSLSYDIVRAHGGELKVETEEGNGAQFIIHLPLSNNS